MPEPAEAIAEARGQDETPASTSTDRAGSSAGEATAPTEQRQPAAAAAAASEDDDDDDETCGFCIFMKGGGCKDVFKDWSKCVDSERKTGGDFAADCREQTYALRECMLKHREYYAPVLEEEADFVADKDEAAKS